MRYFFAAIMLAWLGSAQAWAQSTTPEADNSPPTSHVPGNYYVLSLIWRSAFCAEAENAGLKECQPGVTAMPLMLDGLSPYWDINGDRRRDDGDRYCLADSVERERLMAIDKAAKNEWSALPEAPISLATRDALAITMPRVLSAIDRHEWLKHGTCAGLSADAYFALAMKLAAEVRDGPFGEAIADHAGEIVERKILTRVFRQRYGKERLNALTLNCEKGPNGKDMLVEVRLRIRRDRVDRGVVGSSLDIPDKEKRGSCGRKFLIAAP